MELSKVYTKAVDYQKRGYAVERSEIPKDSSLKRPIWDEPEIHTSGRHYYSGEELQNERALGVLFRAIKLPAMEDALEHSKESLTQLDVDPVSSDAILHGLLNDCVLRRVLGTGSQNNTGPLDDSLVEPHLNAVAKLFISYREELIHICQTHTVSRNRLAMLTEEEVFVGTIIAKTSDTRRRNTLISTMRERSGILLSQ